MAPRHEATNATLGKQAWSSTPAAQMLGAGTSNSHVTSEIGMSADPAAMRHGLKTQPAHQQQPGEQCEQATHAGMQRSVSTAISQQRQRMEPVIRRQKITRNSEQHQNNNKHEQVSAGQATIVSPAATKKPLYEMAMQHLKGLLLGSPPDALSLGPPWTKWPDFARMNNINALVSGLWPSISEAVTQQVVMQVVPQVLADTARQYGKGVLTNLELVTFDLGKIPPRLDGIKVYDEVDDEQVLLELAIGWGSNIKVTLGATLTLLGYTIRIPLTVQNLQLHTRLRVTAQPLMDHFPFAGSAGVSLVEPPHVECEWPVGGIDVLALPGIRGLFRVAVRLASRQLAVYPKGIAVPLIAGGAAAASGPAGMLEVRLVRVSGLRSEDLVGHSDPYVILRVRTGRVLRSRTINNNNNPEFDEVFKMLIDDVDMQVLQVIVMDEDLIGGGKVMGVAQMPLKQSAAIKMPRTKVPLTLTLHKLMGPTHGLGGVLQLPIKVAGLPLSAAATGGRKIYQNLAGALGVGGGSSRSTRVSKLSKVLDQTGWLGPSEEYLAEKGQTGDGGTRDTDTVFTNSQRVCGIPNQDSSSSSSCNCRTPHNESLGKSDWDIKITAATPAECDADVGPDQAGPQPISPEGSFSSFQTALSRSSAGSSVAASSLRDGANSTAVPQGTSPLGGLGEGNQGHDSSLLPQQVRGVRESYRPANASETGASSGLPGRKHAAAASHVPYTTHDAQLSSQHGAGDLSRLHSQSAPLVQVYTNPGGNAAVHGLQVGRGPTAAAAVAAAAEVQHQPEVELAEISSSSGSCTSRGSSRQHKSKVVRIGRALGISISKTGKQTVCADDADSSPPTEVVEHNKRAQQQQKEMGSVRQMQQDATPGETGKGLSGDQMQEIYRGTVFLELTYTPFAKPPTAATGAGASPATASASISAASAAAILPHDKGILAVHLIRARGLGGWQGEADPYVTLSLMDSAGVLTPGGSRGSTGAGDQTMRSTTIYNEDSPRWNEKFDFIDVRAGSILLATVWDQATIIDAATSLKISRARFRDQVLGRVKVAVIDVANAGRIRKRWPLQGAMMGELELVLQWIPVHQMQR